MGTEKAAAALSDALGLPPETLSGLVRVTLTARRQATVEHHGGLVGYGEDHVELRDGPGRVRIVGSGLELRSMDRETLVVVGRIAGVEYA